MKIDFAAMTKEQKQLLFLGALVGATALYAAVFFGIMPMLSGWTNAKSELADLEHKLETADRLVRNTQTLRNELTESEQSLRQRSSAYVPENENTLAWVTRRIYQQGRDLGIDIEAVAPSTSGFQLAALDRTKGTYDRFFDYYGVRVTTNCDFPTALRFIAALETSNPFMVVGGLVMASNMSDPELHSFQIDLQWPLWVDAEGAAQIRTLEGEPHG